MDASKKVVRRGGHLNTHSLRTLLNTVLDSVSYYLFMFLGLNTLQTLGFEIRVLFGRLEMHNFVTYEIMKFPLPVFLYQDVRFHASLGLLGCVTHELFSFTVYLVLSYIFHDLLIE